MKRNKIKVEIDYKKLTEEEVSSHKNFKKLHANYHKMTAPLYKRPKFLGGLIVVAVVIAVVFLENEKEENLQQSKSTTFIQPPLKGVNINYEKYQLNVSNADTIEYKTGSRIIIPSNIFVDAAGKDVEGEVEIRYREFHDAVDFFLSGIPMTYDSAGTNYVFESAGMLEILGFKDDKPVHIKPGKNIQVQMASKQEGTKYNLYQLDTVNRNWICRGKDKVVSSAMNEEKIISDTLSLMQHTEKELVEIKKEIKKLESKKPIEPKKADAQKYTFNIDVDAQEFPELAIYKNSVFEVASENKDFKPEYSNIIWENAILKSTGKDVNYILTLKKGTTEHAFVVYPVFKGENYTKAVADYNNKYKAYMVALANRRAEEKVKMEEYEKKLKAIELRKTDERKNWNICRTFAINNFGIWNSDCPWVWPRGVELTPQYTDQKNNDLNITVIYLVEKNQNAIFTYNSRSVFVFNPQAENMAWTVTTDGKIAVLMPEDFKKISKKSGACTIQMNVVEQKMQSEKDIKEYFGI